MKSVLGLGLGESKTKRIVNGLLTRGVLKASATKPVIYNLTAAYPDDPSQLNSLREIYSIKDTDIETGQKQVEIIPSKIEPAHVSEMIENYLRAKVEDVDLVFYPYYIIKFEKPDGCARIEVLDGMIGNLSERITKRLMHT